MVDADGAAAGLTVIDGDTAIADASIGPYPTTKPHTLPPPHNLHTQPTTQDVSEMQSTTDHDIVPTSPYSSVRRLRRR